MKQAVNFVVFSLLFFGVFATPTRAADFEISEFMAVNSDGLLDEDGETSDWIEVHNISGGPASLGGYYLTDDPGNLTQWQFPETNLAANAYMVVFASNKNRDTPGGELHLNFRLSSSGEYLALVEPNGTNIVTEFDPFPVQIADVSYGLARVASTEITLLPSAAPAKALVPANDSLEPPGAVADEIRPWTETGLDDSSWLSGTTGVGFDLLGTYNPFIGLNVGAMQGVNASVYIRIPFEVEDPSALASLALRLQYDDGIVVYLNGFEVYRDNILNDPITPTWNSEAAANRSGLTPLDVDITSLLDLLQVGENILAIQGLNRFVGGSDLLVLAEVLASGDTGLRVNRYFPEPTPGLANNLGVDTVGPVITSASHAPNVPTTGDDLVVTANIRDAFDTIASATLHYRLMYDPEVAVPFLDDGMSGDEGTGDGVFGAVIPRGSMPGPGQMIRWYITALDADGNGSRFPPFEDPLNSPEYLGTIVHNPVLTNPLPVLHWFIPADRYNAAATDSGARCSLFYLGEFYDNLNINVHGQSSRGFPKHSYDVDFHPGYNFRWEEGQPRADDINLLTTYPDKAAMRNMLGYDTYRDADCPYHFVVPVRVERNGVFEGTYHIVENGDENWLDRLQGEGIDAMSPRGALYKMYNTFQSSGDATGTGAEKKTRKNEGKTDLLNMWNGVTPASNTQALRNYAYDNINIPQVLNHLAARVVTGDIDCCHKNYYYYRDTEGTGEWQMLPWDIDLSYGRLWNGSDTYWDEVLHPDRGAFTGNNNKLPQRLFADTQMRQIYLRRLRTLMDTMMQPPGTPEGELYYEEKIDYWAERLAPDSALDLEKWGTWGNGSSISTCCVQTLQEAADEIKDFYLPARRLYMYNNIGEVPDAQPADAVVTFGAIDVNPVSGNQAEEYFVLHNGNNYAVDISGWKITNAVEHTFRGGVVIPANTDLYVAADVNAFRARATAPTGGAGLYLRGGYKGQLSARGETLALVDTTGRLVSSQSFPPTPSLAQSFLRVTEIMYNPVGGVTNSGDYEFIELKNTGLATIDLTGVKFNEGILFDFTGSAVTSLGPGEHVLVVRNLAAFEERYGAGLNVAGVYAGSLNDGGERISLDDASNEKILDFDYNNSWYPITDGLGFSLVIVNENALFSTWDMKASWRASGVDGGSPGSDDAPLAAIAGVVVNEVLAHTDDPVRDAIELFNTNSTEVDIGGWYISDDLRNPKKYRIPTPTVVSAGGHVVFTEDDFNADPLAPESFSFSSTGDEAYIYSADAQGNLTGFFHGFSFGASATGVPFGPYVNSVGQERIVALSALTLGGVNAGPKVGPVVISEISYHPPDLQSGIDLIDNRVDEYIELENITESPIDLSNWRLTGDVDLTVPAGVTIQAGGHVLLVPFNPANNALALASFRAKHGLSESVPVVGPLSANLSNSGASLRVSRPDSPNGNQIPYIRVDRVDYSDQSPWSLAADGIGLVLQRLDPAAYGDDPINWTAAGANPGEPFVLGTLPTITVEPQDLLAVAFNDAGFSVQVSGPGPFSYQWRFNGANLVGATSDTLVLTSVQPSQAGEYQVAVWNASGSAASRVAILTVAIPASIITVPQSQSVPAGTNVTFTIGATSSTPITYQWRFNGVPIPGETGTTLTLLDVQLGEDNGTYDVIVTDGVGSIVSPPANLTVLVRPAFLVHPLAQEVPEGSTVTLWVQSSGTLPMGYRWRRGGATVQIEPSVFSYLSFLTITNFSIADVGLYSVIATNEAFFAPGQLSGRANLTLGLPVLDSDGDGIPDSVEDAEDLNSNDATDAGMDKDGDGFSNLEEHIAGTRINDGGSFPRLTAIELNGETRVSFEAKANKFYTIQYTDGLNPPVWQKLIDPVPVAMDEIVEVVDPTAPAGVERYYRFVTPRQE